MTKFENIQELILTLKNDPEAIEEAERLKKNWIKIMRRTIRNYYEN